MQRFCQTMDLYDDPELIAAYVAEHDHVWEEVKDGYADLPLRDTALHDYGHHRRIRFRTGLYPAGYPAPPGGMGSPHGQIPEGPTGRFSAREMETDETDIQAVRQFQLTMNN